MKIYITKYALTNGILAVVAGYSCITSDDRVCVQSGILKGMCFTKNEYAYTLSGALQKAEEMRNKKIKQLEKQITKLRQLQIKHPVE